MHKVVQHIGLFLFVLCLGLFTALPFIHHSEIDDAFMREAQAKIKPDHWAVLQDKLQEQEHVVMSKWHFIGMLDDLFEYANQKLPKDNQIWLYDRTEYKFYLVKYAIHGPMNGHEGLFFLFIFGGAILGALMFIVPQFDNGPPGIKNDGIFFSKMTALGWLGILTGSYLILFYIALYFGPYCIAEAIAVADPFSRLLNGHEASQWFMYGFLYTLAIVVMGIRMLAKYRGNPYQRIRTFSVMFFQLGFAFIIPQILSALNQPANDLKNIWPLDYSFFFDYRMHEMTNNGAVGMLFLIVGLAMLFIAVPVFTYLYGKRWYCSWVCGCGGLAETFGDPYRQLSDKSMQGWQIERVVIHGILVLAVFMTAVVLLHNFNILEVSFMLSGYVVVPVIFVAGMAIWFYHKRQFPTLGSNRVLAAVVFVTIGVAIGYLGFYLDHGSVMVNFSSYEIRSFYGFSVGSVFAGVIGTGFYPMLGNRAWCRFGCPLSAMFGIIQRFKSRFRITTNGDQCISCGNCSTYCEQGIDVRSYAQRGQNIVRASCVGCGVCAAVCPRGVLRLENGPDDQDVRTGVQAIHISRDEVKVLS